MRTVYWDDDDKSVCMIDQRLLPGEFVIARFHTHQDVAQAIQDMVIRGAPAIGAAAGFGLALAAVNSEATDLSTFRQDILAASDTLRAARPTAVNLAWALTRIETVLEQTEGDVASQQAAALAEAKRLADEDVEINKRMARHGAALIEDGDTIIHHCNTGALATVDWGTALGVIRMAHEQGKNIHVLVDETRPRLQGARLTAWEL
ncbi:MAG: S-methyl-5-thioribose-1-phosphate isomerase, partial [Anaerolineales bacterium]|nr:S-methyl-5-thioribose-1-phosphate isomerase [Anaerolineales bacterium]